MRLSNRSMLSFLVNARLKNSKPSVIRFNRRKRVVTASYVKRRPESVMMTRKLSGLRLTSLTA